jgi:hypothetical protein
MITVSAATIVFITVVILTIISAIINWDRGGDFHIFGDFMQFLMLGGTLLLETVIYLLYRLYIHG